MYATLCMRVGGIFNRRLANEITLQAIECSGLRGFGQLPIIMHKILAHVTKSELPPLQLFK